ncbi:MAG: alpha/beta hydrolase [Verrucomicrobiales bacterium]
MSRTAIISMLAACATYATPAATDWKNLWPDTPPGGTHPATITETVSERGHFSDISTPPFKFFPAPEDKHSGAAVVIFPGGAYGVVAAGHEGDDYANWLNQQGISAMVVKYRVSRKQAAGMQFPVPLLDARRAIRTARSNATEWNLDPEKIGVMGSSAGGHLASMCATLWDQTLELEPDDPVDQLSCRPDFAILIYPVISLSTDWTHKGSRRNLLGTTPAPGLQEKLSTDLRVTENTPPCFLLHAADDPGVPARNSLEFASACLDHKVPVVCHLLSQGGHGFGLNGKGDSANWPRLLADWLANRKLSTPR